MHAPPALQLLKYVHRISNQNSLNQTRASQACVTESDVHCGHHTLKTGTLSATLLITKDTAEVETC